MLRKHIIRCFVATLATGEVLRLWQNGGQLIVHFAEELRSPVQNCCLRLSISVRRYNACFAGRVSTALRCMQSQVDGALSGHLLRLVPVLEIS